MAAARSTKTVLRFGLVSADIALYKSSGEADKPKPWDTDPPRPANPAVSETQIVTRGVSDPLATSEPRAKTASVVVEPPVVRKGIRREDGSFVDLTDQIEAITERTKLEEIRIADFIRLEQVQRERVLGSYYLVPDGPGAAKVVRLLFEAMKETKRAAVVKFTKRSRQSLGVLVPHACGAVVLVELAWAEDLREVPEKALAPQEIKVTDEEIRLGVELVHAMSSTRKEALDTLRDDARELRQQLVDSVLGSGPAFSLPERPESAPDGAEVVDLMRHGLKDREALRRAAA